MSVTTQISLNKAQLFSLISAIESVPTKNQTAKQLKAHKELCLSLIPVLEAALDEIDALSYWKTKQEWLSSC